MKHPHAAALLALSLWNGGPAPQRREAPADYRVGVARVDITPDYPVRLSGYGNRKSPNEGVAERIHARALAISSGRGPAALWLAIENCGISTELGDAVAREIRRTDGIPRDRIVLTSTHTHAAPMLTGVLPNLFAADISAAEQAAIDRYTRELAAQLAAVARTALADRRPARLGWARGQVDFAANRRTPGGPVDHDLPVLRAVGPDGRLRAILLTYACHCTSLAGEFNRIHGDWAGSAMERLEERNPGVIVLVSIGCGADSNPKPMGRLEDAERHGRSVADAVTNLLAGPLRPLRGALACRLERIALPFEPLPTRSEWVERAGQPRIVGYHARKNLARLDRGETLPQRLPYTVAVWTFGEDLAFVFLAGEVVVDYALRLRRDLDPDRLWISAYANGVPCYIPSRRILDEGGYEPERSMGYYDRPARLTPEVEELVVQSVRRQVPAAYRAPPRPGPQPPFEYPLNPTGLLGVADATIATQVTPEGTLFTGYTELVFLAGQPLRPISQRARRLADGWLPIVEYEVVEQGVRLELALFAAELPELAGNPVNLIRVRAATAGDRPARTSFAVGQRYLPSADPREASKYRFRRPARVDATVPYARLPYERRYYQEGVEFDTGWEYRLDDRVLLRGGQALLVFPAAGAIRQALPEAPYTGPFRDPAPAVDHVTGVVRYDLDLAPGQLRELVFKMPARPVAAGSAELEALGRAELEPARRRVADEWRRRLGAGMELELTERKVLDTFRASLVTLYLGRERLDDGQYRQTPGKLNYRAFFLRDSSFFAHAYDVSGHPEDAAKVLRYFLEWQQPDGNFVSDMWDGWGQTLWAFGEHAARANDRAFAASVYPAVVRAVDWLEPELARDAYGTFPAGRVVDAEYLAGRFGHPTGWNFHGLGGLRGAMKLAAMLGRTADLERYRRMYERWHRALEARLAAITPRIGGRIPPGLDDPTGQDGATWGNLLAIYPVEILDPWDARVTATLDWSRARYLEGVARWEGNDRVRAAGGPPRVHGYLTAVNAESALIRGEQEQALRELYAMLVHTNATHGASEQMLPGTRDPVGQPQPHGWFAASIVNLVRDLLVRERASELHLLSALSPEWLRRRGDVVRVTRAPTYFGEIDLRLERLDAALGIDLTARFHTAPARVVLHVPWYLADRLRRVTADGVEIALPPGKPESIPLAPGARRVELALADWPDLPEISYRSAVARFLEDFERTRGWWSAWSRSGKRPPGDEPR